MPLAILHHILSRAYTHRLHLNVTVGQEQGVEAHLLHGGASYHAFAPITRSLVLERYPRLNGKQELDVHLRQQVTLRPDSWIALLYGAFQCGNRIVCAPYEEQERAREDCPIHIPYHGGIFSITSFQMKQIIAL